MPDFITRHDLWTDDQKKLAADLKKRIDKDGIRLVRVTWADPHGSARAKMVSAATFKDALASGYNINVATSTLDASGGRVFASFKRGGGMGLDEMTGSPNLRIIPDPTTFRTLPWAPGVGWVLCDEYFRDGTPFHFSTRHVLRRQLKALDETGAVMKVGLEVEWYLAHILDDHLAEENIGWPGTRGQPVATAPPEPGFTYHSETNLDIMQPILSELAETYEHLGLPLRSLENEWGPGQLECTFSAQDALKAADDYLLFRTATRQVCRRRGMFATFMARPALKGYYASGWHLHASITDKTGENLLTPSLDGDYLSPYGLAFLAGVLEQAGAASVFATPTVNGHRRFKANSLAPDRAVWGHDHRGAMVRVIGGKKDAATRLENRAGEPAANPYLFIASQIVAGLDGVANERDPGPPDDEPYAAKRALLPTNLGDALSRLDQSALFRAKLGDVFVDYLIRLKRAELDRFKAHCREAGIKETDPDVTRWEQNEYFDFF